MELVDRRGTAAPAAHARPAAHTAAHPAPSTAHAHTAAHARLVTARPAVHERAEQTY